ncbi:MAG: DUF5677 domain-containing protein [Pseudomonadota bacterium]
MSDGVANNVVMPVPPALIQILCRLEAVLSNFVTERRLAAETLGRYESEVESLNLTALGIRHIEGFLRISAQDLILFPAAACVARSALEVNLKAAWLVSPSDHFAREARWLAHLQGEERTLERLVKELSSLGVDGSALTTIRDQIRMFREEVQARMPAAAPSLSRTLNVKEMCEEIGGGSAYKDYIFLSQYVHGEHHSTRHFRGGGLGTKKELGEDYSLVDWALLCKAVFYSLAYFGRKFLGSVGGNPDAVLTPEECEDLDKEIDALANRAASA